MRDDALRTPSSAILRCPSLPHERVCLSRRALNQVYIFNTEMLEWKLIQAQGESPTPR